MRRARFGVGAGASSRIRPLRQRRSRAPPLPPSSSPAARDGNRRRLRARGSKIAGASAPVTAKAAPGRIGSAAPPSASSDEPKPPPPARAVRASSARLRSFAPRLRGSISRLRASGAAAAPVSPCRAGSTRSVFAARASRGRRYRARKEAAVAVAGRARARRLWRVSGRRARALEGARGFDLAARLSLAVARATSSRAVNVSSPLPS